MKASSACLSGSTISRPPPSFATRGTPHTRGTVWPFGRCRQRGGVVVFELQGGLDAGVRVLNHVALCARP